MTAQEFHAIRKPLYLDSESLLVRFPTAKHMNSSHAEWFQDSGIPFIHTVRGYYYKSEEEEYVMLYWNDFEIPNLNVAILTYIFEYFPNIQWIGLGCHKGVEGDIWKPKLIIKRIKYEK